MSSANLLNPRKPVAWLIAAAAGAALFASGALVARATLDDDEAPAPNTSKLVAPGIGTDSIANGASPASLPGAPASGLAGRGGTDMSYPGCQAPLPAGVIVNGVIDPSKAGFVPALPTSGFTPSSISLAVQGDCAADGTAKSGELVLGSQWQHDATGLTAYVS